MDPYRLDPDSIRDRPLAVIGLGSSGFAAAALAQYAGAQVFASESGTSPRIETHHTRLEACGVTCETGGHSPRIFDYDLWILSPGIAEDSELVEEALSRGITVVGEIEFAGWFTTAPILAVTGSNGKTTTSHILAAMCRTGRMQAVLAGNVGYPFSTAVLEDLRHPGAGRLYVLEISSFQVEFIRSFRPHISVFLNITPDHLDRYPSMEKYIAAKMNLARYQTGEDFIVYNRDDPRLAASFAGSAATAVPFSLNPAPGLLFNVNQTKIYDHEHATLTELSTLSLPGRHNLANFLAAATAAHLMEVPREQISTVMRTIPAIPHRLEPVGCVNGVRYINDSKATNLDSVKVALDSFTEPVILLLGGKDKGGDFRELIPPCRDHVKLVIAYGQAREKILTALGDAVRSISVEDLRDAVKVSHDSAKPGDVTLLSPGCASFDQFTNFEERGHLFRELVRRLGQTS